jgi:NAD(P)H-dependent FMN reductase
MQKRPRHVVAIADAGLGGVGWADGFIFVTPEYNYGPAAVPVTWAVNRPFSPRKPMAGQERHPNHSKAAMQIRVVLAPCDNGSGKSRLRFG